jgi:hypothetical protein
MPRVSPIIQVIFFGEEGVFMIVVGYLIKEKFLKQERQLVSLVKSYYDLCLNR